MKKLTREEYIAEGIPMISNGTLIAALRSNPHIFHDVYHQHPAHFIPEGEEITLEHDVRSLDLTPQIIRVLYHMDKEIHTAQEETRKVQAEFEKYKKENEEFRQMKKFLEEKRR